MNILINLVIGIPLAFFGLGSDDDKNKDNEKPITVIDEKYSSWPKQDDKIETDRNMLRENVVMVLDMSGSMFRTQCSGSFISKSHAAKFSIKKWIKNVDDETNIGLIAFNNGVTKKHVDLGINNRKLIIDKIKYLNPNGGTPLKDAVNMAHLMLENQARKQKGYGVYKMVIITDGKYSPENQNPKVEINSILNNPYNPVEIHTIGFCIEDSALNQPGKIYYKSAKNPKELKKGLDNVISESVKFKGPNSFGDWTK